MSTYNLNELAGKDYFEIELDKFKYIMTYPSSKEIMQLNEVANNTKDWQEKIDSNKNELLTAEGETKIKLEAEVKDLEEKAKIAKTSFIDWCMQYIKSENDAAPNLKEKLIEKNVRYLLAFMKIVQTELNDSQ